MNQTQNQTPQKYEKKLSEMKQNETTVIVPCVVLAVSVLQTSTGKHYASLTISDGTKTIDCKKWNWNLSTDSINVNDIISIYGTMDSWNGNEQLVILTYSIIDGDPLKILIPDTTDNINTLLRLINEIKNDLIRSIVKNIINEHMQRLILAPAAIKVHHNKPGGLLIHTIETAYMAKAIAESTGYVPSEGYGIELDLVIAGAILHDIGKLYTMNLDKVSPVNTFIGETSSHVTQGILCIERAHADILNKPLYFNKDKFDMENLQYYIDHLKHIVESHHGKYEYGSPTLPRTLEAFIVHLADMTSAQLSSINVALKNSTGLLTDKVFFCGNVPMINTMNWAHIYDIREE